MIDDVANIFPPKICNIFRTDFVGIDTFGVYSRGYLPVELRCLRVRINDHNPVDGNPQYHLIVTIVL